MRYGDILIVLVLILVVYIGVRICIDHRWED